MQYNADNCIKNTIQKKNKIYFILKINAQQSCNENVDIGSKMKYNVINLLL